MKKIRLPNPIILATGGIGAFWIADIINPGFNPIGIMIFMLIPIIVFEFLYPEPEIDQLIEQAHYHALTNPEEAEAKPGELLDDKNEDETEEKA